LIFSMVHVKVAHIFKEDDIVKSRNSSLSQLSTIHGRKPYSTAMTSSIVSYCSLRSLT